MERCYWPIVSEAMMLLAVKTVKSNYKNKEPSQQRRDSCYCRVPYIKGTAENIERILQPNMIRVAHNPINILRQSLTNVKDRNKPSE